MTIPDERAMMLHYWNAEQQKDHHDMVWELFPSGDDMSVLDVGCGFGDFSARMPPDWKYIGIDVSPDVIKEARKLYPGRTFRKSDRLVESDVIVGIACIADEIVLPWVLLERMYRRARKAVIITVWNGFVPQEILTSWCPKSPDVVMHRSDFIGLAMYK